MDSQLPEMLQTVLAEREIHRVLVTYCRAADRVDLDLMRSCYWPDATDDHGSYRGGLDGFIAFVGGALARFETTNHVLGNVLIDCSSDGSTARSETSCVAYHRYRDSQGALVDMTAGLRYVDRFERRDGQWRIARRVCAYDWRRTDPVHVEGFGFGPDYVRGRRDDRDVLHWIMDHDRIPDARTHRDPTEEI
jgi:hypothetical protein